MDARFEPNGVVALLTDFGLSDPYVGQMKGVLLARFPAARIVDLAHGVPPQDVRVGAFFLARSRASFAPGTVFVAVVDPGVGSERKLLAAVEDERLYLAPDNGLLPAALDARALLFELDPDRCALPARSRTFHGRDVFAPAAAWLANGGALDAIARPLHGAPTGGPSIRAVRRSVGEVHTEVLFADHYGNLVLTATPDDLGGDPRGWRAEAAGRAIGFVGTYAEAGSGEACALVDSFGSIELAVRDGSAAAELGLHRGDPVVLRRNPC
ncbi:MAG: SAM-dependent chlorinase/fluorinase [Planctomycetes bacterium]|nr:SAM-dependent chlorinase/fluorinase [Planctomycetota bacterium]